MFVGGRMWDLADYNSKAHTVYQAIEMEVSVSAI